MYAFVAMGMGGIAFGIFHLVPRRWAGPGIGRLHEWIERRSNWAFLFMVAAFLFVFVPLAVLKSYALQYYGGDLAQYDQEVWNSVHGRLLEATTVPDTPNLLGKSFSPIVLALVPLYTIWPHSVTLSILGTLCLAAASFPIYWFARQRLGHLMALVVGAAFFLSPEVTNLQSIQFYEITLATPFLAYALFFLLRRHYKGFLVVLGVSLLVKEEIALITIAIGLYVLLVQHNVRLGLALCIGGALTAVLLLEIVTPYFRGTPFGAFYYFGNGAPYVANHYAYLGGNLEEILATLLSRPGLVLQHVLIPPKIEYLLDFFVPLAFIPFLGLDVLVMAVPTFSYSILSDFPGQYDIIHHYMSPLIPIFFFATIAGLERLMRSVNGWSARFSSPRPGKIYGLEPAFSAALITSSVLGYYFLSLGPLAANFQPYVFTPTARSAFAFSLMSKIPMGAAVETHEEFEDKLSDRQIIYAMPMAPDYRQIDYLFADTFRAWYNLHKASWDYYFSTGYFETLSNEDGFILAKRREPDHPLDIQFSDQLRLLGYTIPLTSTLQGGMTLRPIVEWQAENVLTQTYGVTVELEDAAGHMWATEDGEPDGGSLPTNQWEAGKSVGDQYSLSLPPTMPAGDYELSIGVHDTAGGYLSPKDSAGHRLDSQVSIARVHIDKNKASFTANQLSIPAPLFVDMNELRFMGYVPPRQTATPGDLLQVGLYWRARAKPQGDYEVAVQLRDASGAVAFEQAARPANGTYPTTEWDAGEVLLDWHDFNLPKDIAPGEYQVWVALHDTATRHTIGETKISSISIAP